MSSVNILKNGVHLSGRESMWHSFLAGWIHFHTPPHGTPHVSPCNIPEFCVDCRQAAGEVDEMILARVPLAQCLGGFCTVLYGRCTRCCPQYGLTGCTLFKGTFVLLKYRTITWNFKNCRIIDVSAFQGCPQGRVPLYNYFIKNNINHFTSWGLAHSPHSIWSSSHSAPSFIQYPHSTQLHHSRLGLPPGCWQPKRGRSKVRSKCSHHLAGDHAWPHCNHREWLAHHTTKHSGLWWAT